ncbi:MAG TPA: DUF4157 domain-containing protein [Kofleriaceae bacterium]|nr:DUF4157 domain-containing protein [Kofleriaceae bacterium]
MKAVAHDHEHHHDHAPALDASAFDDAPPAAIHRSALSAPSGGQAIDPAPAGGSGFYDAINAGLVVMRSGGGEIDHGATALVSRAAQGSGHALPGELRGAFEHSLGTDLGGVRVHTDGAAAAASDALGARAYAVGQDVYMGAGQYNPSSPDGAFLLAHEVAHTVQQRGASTGPQCKLEVSEPGDALEADADQAATAMVLGRSASVASAGVGAARKIMRFGNSEYRTIWGIPAGDSAFFARSSRVGFNGYMERFVNGNPRPVQTAYAPPGQPVTIDVQHGVNGAFRIRLVVGYEISQRLQGSQNGSMVVTSSIVYRFRPDGSIEFTNEYDSDAPHLISGDLVEGMMIRQRVTPPAAGAGAGPFDARFAFVFDGGNRTGSTQTVTSPEGRAGQASHTTGQFTPPAPNPTAYFHVLVNVIGAPAPRPNEAPGGGNGGAGATNTNSNSNSNTNTNTNTSSSSSSNTNSNSNTVSPNIQATGGAGGAGGNAQGGSVANVQGGSATATATGNNVTIVMPPGQAPQPQPQSQPQPATSGMLGDDIGFETGESEASPGAQNTIARFVRRIGRDPQLVAQIRAGQLRFRVSGYASRTERRRGVNGPLSQHRAETVESLLRTYFREELGIVDLSFAYVRGEGAANAEERAGRYENEEQRAVWTLAP